MPFSSGRHQTAAVRLTIGTVDPLPCRISFTAKRVYLSNLKCPTLLTRGDELASPWQQVYSCACGRRGGEDECPNRSARES